MSGSRPRPMLPRFWAKVDKSGGPDACWPWTAYRTEYGYGIFRMPSATTNTPAHRVAYALLGGPIPEGWQVDHLCRNRACVNPRHLEAVTRQENIRRERVLRIPRSRCALGHALSPDNTYCPPRQGHHGHERRCRICRRAQKQRQRLRAKVAA